MNKETFLMVLREKLSILDKNEIDDIIQEYSSHIDERVSHGDSEMDAVKAFGNVDALASEILKGYKISGDYKSDDWFSNLSRILSDLANSVVEFFERNVHVKHADVSNTLASVLVAVILLFGVNVVANILNHVGTSFLGFGDSWYGSDPLMIIWVVVVNLIRLLAIVMIIYTTYRNIVSNKAPMFFGNKNQTDVKKEKHSTNSIKDVNVSEANRVNDNYRVNNKNSGIERTIIVIVKVFIILSSIPFYFVILGLLFGVAVIVGLMIKGVFFFGVLLILLGLIVVISSIIGMIFKLIGGIK